VESGRPIFAIGDVLVFWEVEVDGLWRDDVAPPIILNSNDFQKFSGP